MLGEHFADGLNLNIRYSVYSNGYVDTENKWLGKHICKSLKKGAKKKRRVKYILHWLIWLWVIGLPNMKAAATANGIVDA